ncbi:hypothetical protein ACWGB8_17240 [Kitasatospora sp. NPDC054939]
MEALSVMVGLALLIGVTLLVLAVVGTVKVTKKVASKAAKEAAKQEAVARRAIENVALKAKSYTKIGPAGQISAVRLSLRTSLDNTRHILEGGLAEDSQLGESLQLLTRLDAHAAELDRELRLLEREPDVDRIAAKLPELRERAERITHAAETMRWAAQDRMHRFADDELGRLSQECESEAGALRHWDAVGSAGPAAGAAGAAGAPAGSSAGTGAAGAGAAGAGSAAAREEASQRPALAPGAGNRPTAEELLGLADPLTRLGQRLRKPNAGPSAG